MKLNPKILHLSLKKQWFDLMVTGEKDEEFREDGKWIKSRLFNKDGSRKEYDYVKFVNGYGSDKPYFISELLFVTTIEVDFIPPKTYSDGSEIEMKKGLWVLGLGEIIEKGNLNNKPISGSKK